MWQRYSTEQHGTGLVGETAPTGAVKHDPGPKHAQKYATKLCKVQPAVVGKTAQLAT